MEIEITSSETNSTINSGEVIETEEDEILVYVDVDYANDDFTSEDLKNFKIIGLDSDEPIIQVGNKFFGGSWDEVVGTAVFFKETTPQSKRCYFSAEVPKPLKFIGKTQKSLKLKRAFISHLKSDSDKECNSDVVNGSSNTEVVDNIDMDAESVSNQSFEAKSENAVKLLQEILAKEDTP